MSERNRPVLLPALLIISLFVGVMLLVGCETSGAVTDAGCQTWRENTPLHGRGDTKKTIDDLTIFNQAMSSAC